MVKFDITIKSCNNCKVLKQITSFKKKKSKCKESNSSKVSCEYCASITTFSGLKGHIKKFHAEEVIPRGVYSANEIKPVSEIIRSKFLEDKIISTFESNSALASKDKCNFFEDKSNSMDKSNFFEDQGTFSADNPVETNYYEYYLIFSKLIAQGIDID